MQIKGTFLMAVQRECMAMMGAMYGIVQLVKAVRHREMDMRYARRCRTHGETG